MQDAPLASWLVKIAGLALAYYVSGRLGLLLAIPPGYATAAWPPSGIALAGILLLGNRVWPGVLIGSFIVNVATAYDTSSVSALLLSVSLPASIGAGASLQALAGAYLVRRVVGFPSPLDNERDIAWFMLLAGPVSCLVNSSIGIATLWVHGLIPTEVLLFNWWTWWVGDSIGVLIFTPFILVFAERLHPVWRRRRLSVALPLACTFVLAVLVFVFVSRQEQHRLQGLFDQRANTLAHALTTAAAEHDHLLRAVQSFVAGTEVADRRHFGVFVRQLLVDFPGILALGWNPRVRDAERASYEAAARRDGLHNFRFTEIDSTGKLARAAQRAEYVPAFFIEPTVGNDVAFGFDIASDPERRSALEKARDTGGPAVTPPIRLLQDPAQQAGFLMALPVYRLGANAETATARRRNLRGYVIAVYRVDDLVDAALRNLDRGDVMLRIADGERILYDSVVTTEKTSAARVTIQRRTTLMIAGREWVLTFFATPEYLAAQRSWAAWTVLAAGLLFTSLLGVFLLILTGRTSRIEQRVAERTGELSTANRQLREQIAERKQAQELLDRKTRELTRSNKELEQFAYVASHDLKEPLRTVANYAQLLAKRFHGKLDPKADEYIAFTVEAVGRMQRLIQDLLAYARVGTEGGVLIRTELTPCLHEALTNLRSTVEESHAEITHDQLPALNADATQITQLFQNLVGNAIKFRGAAAPRVHISAAKRGPEWVIAVRDNGIGIEGRFVERIFEIFQRLHSIDDYPGTGIGLAICKKIVERHGGTIWAESRVGEGTTFYFSLPKTPET
jgi:signal transduction histidine kinase/integral membrane sensor domain MASE1